MEIIPSQILSAFADGIFPSVILPVYTDGIILSVYTIGIYRRHRQRHEIFFENCNGGTTWILFRRIYRRNIPRDSTLDSQVGKCRYHWRNQRRIYRRNISSVSPSVNASIYCLCRHSLFLSSSVSPSSSPSSSTSHLSPPKLQPTTHLNSPLFSTQASTQVSYTFVRGHNIR